MNESEKKPQMTPEKHLAAILTAFGECNAREFTEDLIAALAAAEKDFDGVEDYPEVRTVADLAVMALQSKKPTTLLIEAMENERGPEVPNMVERLKAKIEKAHKEYTDNHPYMLTLYLALEVEEMREQSKRDYWELPDGHRINAGM